MAKRNPFTTEEVKTILQMKHNGYTYGEIADKIKTHSTKSITGYCERNRLCPDGSTYKRPEGERASQFKKILADNGIILSVKPDEIEHVPATVVKEVVKEKIVEKSLNDYKPRELIKNLFDRGYRIENGEIVCYVRQIVQLKDIIAQ